MKTEIQQEQAEITETEKEISVISVTSCSFAFCFAGGWPMKAKLEQFKHEAAEVAETNRNQGFLTAAVHPACSASSANSCSTLVSPMAESSSSVSSVSSYSTSPVPSDGSEPMKNQIQPAQTAAVAAPRRKGTESSLFPLLPPVQASCSNPAFASLIRCWMLDVRYSMFRSCGPHFCFLLSTFNFCPQPLASCHNP